MATRKRITREEVAALKVTVTVRRGVAEIEYANVPAGSEFGVLKYALDEFRKMQPEYREELVDFYPEVIPSAGAEYLDTDWLFDSGKPRRRIGFSHA